MRRENMNYHLFKIPKPPAEHAEAYARDLLLYNCRNLKSIILPLCVVLFISSLFDFFMIFQSDARELWPGILLLRGLALGVSLLSFWVLGPLRDVDDLRPVHDWYWVSFVEFLMVYATIISGFVFPVKESIAPVYVFLFGPVVFLATTPLQTLVHLISGFILLAVTLHTFAPEMYTVRFQLANTGVLLVAVYVLSCANYSQVFHSLMSKRIIKKKNQELSQANEKAHVANKAKSDFLAAISHEIRTPMNSILGMTEVALHSCFDEEYRDCIETVRESGVQLMDVVNDILDFSYIEAGKMRLISAHFDLKTTIQSALKTVGFKALEKKLELDYTIAADVPQFVKGDPGRLRQILVNLLDNAVVYSEEGRVLLSVTLYEEGVSDPLRSLALQFSVKDTGPGIPQEMRETLFEPFAENHAPIPHHYGSSGLGLAIVHYLVEKMGGEIRVVTVMGKGSNFIFTVQLEKGNEALAQEPEIVDTSWSANRPVKASRVLLVDDNALNVKVELLHLDRLGMKTTVAQNGLQALEILAQEKFDIVLMDLEMPELNGYETAHLIRTGNPDGKPILQRNIPILAVSAHAFGQIRHKCEQAKMDGFLAKPVGFGELGTAMRRILGGNIQTTVSLDKKKNGPAILDLAHASSSLGITLEEVRHLVPNALKEITEKFEACEQNLLEKRFKAVALQAHTMKSVAASIGAELTRQAAVKLENSSRRNDGPHALQRLEELRIEIFRLEGAGRHIS